MAQAIYRQHLRNIDGNWLMGIRGFTRASTLGPIAQVIETAGGSSKQVFARADLPLSLLQTPAAFVPLKDHYNLLRHSADELADELFAIRLGNKVTVQDLGTYGQWVVQAPTLLESINRANNSMAHMLQSATELSLRINSRNAIWSYDSKDSASEGRQHNEMLALCFMIEIAREHLGRNWVPDRVIICGRPIHNSANLEQLMSTDVSFHDGAGCVIFKRQLLATRRHHQAAINLSPDDIGRAINVPNQYNLLDTASALIALELTERLPSTGWVASKLGISQRTLQRKLSAAGSGFSELVQAVQQQRAFDLLLEGRWSIADIAFKLGYCDAAHFSRAFKRWTGMTPTMWRNMADSD